MNDISTFGARVIVKASQTFPIGIPLSQFADDSDPFDIPSQQIKDKAMGANGDLITWGKANPIVINVSLIAGSIDDNLMSTLLEMNRVGKGKFATRDKIDITVMYGNGAVANFTQGSITDGPPASSASSAGRLKSKTYIFAFENMNKTFINLP